MRHCQTNGLEQSTTPVPLAPPVARLTAAAPSTPIPKTRTFTIPTARMTLSSKISCVLVTARAVALEISMREEESSSTVAIFTTVLHHG